MPVRSAKAQWDGTLKEGKGTMSLGSGAFQGAYSFNSRFESGTGTNPEELIGAAHAGCFSMALSAALGKAGFTPKRVSTSAGVHLEIDRHHRDYNFVNAFSTRGERTMIAAGRAPSEPRLGLIARAMKRIAERIDDIDPGIVSGGANASPETAMRADLVRIASWQ